MLQCFWPKFASSDPSDSNAGPTYGVRENLTRAYSRRVFCTRLPAWWQPNCKQVARRPPGRRAQEAASKSRKPAISYLRGFYRPFSCPKSSSSSSQFVNRQSCDRRIADTEQDPTNRCSTILIAAMRTLQLQQAPCNQAAGCPCHGSHRTTATNNAQPELSKSPSCLLGTNLNKPERNTRAKQNKGCLWLSNKHCAACY